MKRFNLVPLSSLLLLISTGVAGPDSRCSRGQELTGPVGRCPTPERRISESRAPELPTPGDQPPSDCLPKSRVLREASRPLRIVAFGDSTTAPRGALPVYLDLLRESLTAKGHQVDAMNAGFGGNTTEAARARFAADVLDRAPDVAIIQFGINDSAIDVWKSPPATMPRVAVEQYGKNLEHFVDRLEERGCEVILMTPNPMRWTLALKRRYGRHPYRPDAPDGFNEILRTYAEEVRRVADEKQVSLVDVYQAFQAYGAAEDQTIDSLLLDGMHPNHRGHQLIADLLTPKVLSKIPTPPQPSNAAKRILSHQRLSERNETRPW